MQALYIGISIAALIAILVVLVLRRRRIYRISALTMLGMTIAVLGGYFYGDSRWIGGSLMGIGVIATIIDVKYVKSHGES
jgi:hypothetical protein